MKLNEVNKTDEISELLNIKLKYEELIYAVAKKYPNETRHQTALKYIQEAESRSSSDVSTSSIKQ